MISVLVKRFCVIELNSVLDGLGSLPPSKLLQDENQDISLVQRAAVTV